MSQGVRPYACNVTTVSKAHEQEKLLNGRRNKRCKLSEQVFFVQPISRLLLFFNCGATTIRLLFHEVHRKYPLPSRLKSQRLVSSVFPQYSFRRSPSATVLPQLSYRNSLTASVLPVPLPSIHCRPIAVALPYLTRTPPTHNSVISIPPRITLERIEKQGPQTPLRQYMLRALGRESHRTQSAQFLRQGTPLLHTSRWRSESRDPWRAISANFRRFAAYAHLS